MSIRTHLMLSIVGAIFLYLLLGAMAPDDYRDPCPGEKYQNAMEVIEDQYGSNMKYVQTSWHTGYRWFETPEGETICVRAFQVLKTTPEGTTFAERNDQGFLAWDGQSLVLLPPATE